MVPVGSPQQPPPPPPLQPPSPPSAPVKCAALIDFVFIIDVSGSVGGVIGAMRSFATDVMQQFTLGADAARFGLVKFEWSGSVVVPLTTDELEMQRGIAALDAGGNTCLQCGFARASEAFSDATPRAGATRVALLLTDGNPNIPVSGALTQANAAADSLKASGVTVFAWGFGSVDESVLNDVATPPAADHAFFSADFSAISALSSKVCAPCGCARGHGLVHVRSCRSLPLLVYAH